MSSSLMLARIILPDICMGQAAALSALPSARPVVLRLIKAQALAPAGPLSGEDHSPDGPAGCLPRISAGEPLHGSP
jgi:hypothetical protein